MQFLGRDGEWTQKDTKESNNKTKTPSTKLEKMEPHIKDKGGLMDSIFSIFGESKPKSVQNEILLYDVNSCQYGRGLMWAILNGGVDYLETLGNGSDGEWTFGNHLNSKKVDDLKNCTNYKDLIEWASEQPVDKYDDRKMFSVKGAHSVDALAEKTCGEGWPFNPDVKAIKERETGNDIYLAARCTLKRDSWNPYGGSWNIKASKEGHSYGGDFIQLETGDSVKFMRDPYEFVGMQYKMGDVAVCLWDCTTNPTGKSMPSWEDLCLSHLNPGNLTPAPEFVSGKFTSFYAPIHNSMTSDVIGGNLGPYQIIGVGSGGHLQINFQNPLNFDASAIAMMVFRGSDPTPSSKAYEFYRLVDTEQGKEIRLNMMVEIKIRGITMFQMMVDQTHIKGSI